jgi:hypothetical protein
MKKWSVTSLVANYEAFWDKVTNEGPQVIRRRGVDFICASPADFEARMGKDYKIAPGNTHEFPDFVDKPKARSRPHSFG